MIGQAIFEHVIDDDGDLTSSSGNGFGCPMFGFKTAVKGTDGALTPGNALGGQAEGKISPALGRLDLTTLDLASPSTTSTR